MTNIEIKARFSAFSNARDILKELGAHCQGVEKQTDTYYQVGIGRLKIRERSGDGAELIQYFRDDVAESRPSLYEVVHVKQPDRVKETLEREHGVRTVVGKEREVWILKNVRIHLDQVEDLGSFLEIEAVLPDGAFEAEGRKQVHLLMDALGICEKDLVPESYCDLLAGSENDPPGCTEPPEK